MNSLIKTIYYRFPALENRNFRYFWSTQCISLVGTWMQRTAQQWLVYTLTDSPFLLGLLGIFQFGPILLFSLFAGVYIDKFPKKKIILLTNTILMLQSLALAWLVWTGKVEYWHIITLATVMGFANTFDMPTRQAFVSELVNKEELPNAVGLNSMIFNLARIVGPALSGIVISYLGIAMTFFVNTLSFIPVLYVLSKIDAPAIIRAHRDSKVLTEVRNGLMYIKRTPALLRSLSIMVIASTLALNFEVILPVFTKEVLAREAGTYSVLLSCMGIGSLFGAATTALRRSEPNSSLVYKCACILATIITIATFVKTYQLMMLTMVIFGYFAVLLTTSTNATLQLNSSDEFRGRVMSVYTLTLAGTTPIGNFIAGTITEYLGPNLGFGICGIILIAALFRLRPSTNTTS